MNHLIPALILTIAATATTTAAGEKNVGLLIEWIQIDHRRQLLLDSLQRISHIRSTHTQLYARHKKKAR